MTLDHTVPEFYIWGGGERWLLGLSWERTLLCMHPNGFTLGVYFWSDGKANFIVSGDFVVVSGTHTHSLLRLIHCQNVSGVTFILLLFKTEYSSDIMANGKLLKNNEAFWFIHYYISVYRG